MIRLLGRGADNAALVDPTTRILRAMWSEGRTIDSMRFVKGHGTQNDFVVLPDPDGALELTPGLVAAICDRRRGVGADGVLRVVPTKAMPEAAGMAAEAEWFMDYRNADGGIAEMCGNGIRVYARYLVEAGLTQPGELRIATRAGVKAATLEASGDVTVDMGRSEVLGEATAHIGGAAYEGLRVSLGNPHLACMVTCPVAELPLEQAPEVDRVTFPEGVNLEVVRSLGDSRLEMRVHERGVGETRSCGTGAVAVAAAAGYGAGRETGTWSVDVPGGRLSVTLDGGTSLLTGPAMLVAEGDLRSDWVEVNACAMDMTESAELPQGRRSARSCPSWIGSVSTARPRS